MKFIDGSQSIYRLTLIGVGAVALLVLVAVWSSTNASIDSLQVNNVSPQETIESLFEPVPKQKPTPIEAKGIYLTANSAANAERRQVFIDLINATELNSVVVDIKDYSGAVLYDSAVSYTEQFALDRNRLGDVQAIIDDFHANDIYVIARQTVFQDPLLAEQFPDVAIKSKRGGLWRDHKGLAWVDPTDTRVWDYNVALAKEAIALGFDEINFDYVRFPSDGNMFDVVYTTGDRARHDVMGDFYEHLDIHLSDEPAYISLDMFGFVMERHDGMSIGQRLEDARDHVDYIYPMMYASHYPSGHIGLANPAAFPGKVLDNGLAKGMPHVSSTRAQIRPWLQAFNIGAVYDARLIREQIDAVEAHTDAGWMLWNASNRYSDDGLGSAL